MQFTANQIAEFVGGSVEGNGQAVVSTFAKIEEGKPESLTFLANAKYTHYLYSTKASVALVSKDFVAEQPLEVTLIRVDNPYDTLALLMRTVDSVVNPQPVGVEQPCYISDGVEVPGGAYIGAFAYIGKNVRLGKNVKIYPQSYIGDNAVIGDDCIIYSGVRIYRGCKIGCRCILHSGCVIGADGFGFAPDEKGHYNKIPQMGYVEISDDVELGANTTVDRATMGHTVIGRGTKIDNLVQVAHNVCVGSHTVIAAQAGIAGSAKIGDHCMLGGQVGVAGHITVGDRTAVGAQSGIPNSVKPDSRLMGYPAIDARCWARQASMLKRLPDLFDRVKALEDRK